MTAGIPGGAALAAVIMCWLGATAPAGNHVRPGRLARLSLWLRERRAIMLHSDQRQIIRAARDVRLAMTAVHKEIQRVAETSGILMALMDNAEGTETLSSIRADTGFQLVKNLGESWQVLAVFFASVGNSERGSHD